MGPALSEKHIGSCMHSKINPKLRPQRNLPTHNLEPVPPPPHTYNLDPSHPPLSLSNSLSLAFFCLLTFGSESDLLEGLSSKKGGRRA